MRLSHLQEVIRMRPVEISFERGLDSGRFPVMFQEVESAHITRPTEGLP